MARRGTADYLNGSSTNFKCPTAAKGTSRPLQHRGNHIASLLAYQQPEALAEQLLAQQEHNNELQDQLKHALTDARHKDVELRRCRQALLAAEGLLQGQQRPCVTILQPNDDQDGNSSTAASGSSSPRTYRERKLSPRRAAAATLSCTQQACLIGALKDQNAALKAAVSQLEQQYTGLAQPGGVASQVGSLQQQLTMVLGQLQQQQQLVQQLACRATDAQQAAQAAAMQVELASRALHEVQLAATAAVQGDMDGKQLGRDLLDLVAALVGPSPAGPSASGPCTSSALAAAQDAHRMLLQQVLLLRGRLPSAAGFAGIAAAAHSRPGSASRSRSQGRLDRPDNAVELLMFLRSHVARLQAMLDSLPGVSAASLQQHAQAFGNDNSSCCTAACPASAGVPCNRQAEAQHASFSSSSSPSQRVRPCSAQTASSSSSSSHVLGLMPATGHRVRPASAAPATVCRKMHSAQQTSQCQPPDLSPYLNFPARRVARGRSSEVAALHGTLQQLQVLLQEQQEQIHAQAAEVMQLQQYVQSVDHQFEAAQQQLAAKEQEVTQSSEAAAGEQQRLQAAMQQLQQHGAQVEQQQAMSQEAAAAERQQYEAEVWRRQQHCGSLQKQLAAAQQERDGAQQASHAREQDLQLMLQQDLISRCAVEQQLQRRVEQLGHLLLQAEQQLKELHAAQSNGQADSLDAAKLARFVLAYAAVLSAELADPEEALGSAGLQQLSAAVAELLAAMRQVLALGASAEGSMSANTEQLEEQLAESTEAVEDCMAALQEVCAASRRASAAGPALLANFNPYARASLILAQAAAHKNNAAEDLVAAAADSASPDAAAANAEAGTAGSQRSGVDATGTADPDGAVLANSGDNLSLVQCDVGGDSASSTAAVGDSPACMLSQVSTDATLEPAVTQEVTQDTPNEGADEVARKAELSTSASTTGGSAAAAESVV